MLWKSNTPIKKETPFFEGKSSNASRSRFERWKRKLVKAGEGQHKITEFLEILNTVQILMKKNRALQDEINFLYEISSNSDKDTTPENKNNMNFTSFFKNLIENSQ